MAEKVRRRRRRVFAPWRQEFRYAGVLALLAVVAIWQGMGSGRLITTVVGIVVAALLAIGARYCWQSGMRRWYGKRVESWAVAEVASQLKRHRRVRCETQVPVPGQGDADLVVTGRRKLRCLVEVKAFNAWNQGWWSIGARESSALLQAADLARSLGCTEVIVWLPRGRPSLVQRIGLCKGKNGVKVAFGAPVIFATRLKRLANRKLPGNKPERLVRWGPTAVGTHRDP